MSNPSGNNASKFVQNGASKRSGSYGIQFNSYDKSGENTQYLISPELSAPNGVNVSFYYKNSKSGYAELFKVGYSTTDTEVGSFTFGDEISESSATWKQYEGSFPAGTKYVAVYYYSNYQYYLYVDDFEFTAPAAGPALAVADGTTAIATGYSYSFGLATSGTTKTFTLSNPGTESIIVNIAATGGFDVSPANATIAAKGEETLTITMPSTSATGAVTITPTADGMDAFVINVSGTIKDPSKLFETLLDGSAPEGWTTSGGTWSWTVQAFTIGSNGNYFEASKPIQGNDFETKGIEVPEDAIEQNVWVMDASPYELDPSDPDYREGKYVWIIVFGTGEENGSGRPAPWFTVYCDREAALSGVYTTARGNLAMGEQVTFMDTNGTASGLKTATNAELRLTFDGFDEDYMEQGFYFAHYTGRYIMTCDDGKTYTASFFELLCNSQTYNSMTGQSSYEYVGMYGEAFGSGVEEVLIEQGFDLTQPMYNIMGQQVDATYKGIVIQNGKKIMMQ